MDTVNIFTFRICNKKNCFVSLHYNIPPYTIISHLGLEEEEQEEEEEEEENEQEDDDGKEEFREDRLGCEERKKRRLTRKLRRRRVCRVSECVLSE